MLPLQKFVRRDLLILWLLIAAVALVLGWLLLVLGQQGAGPQISRARHVASVSCEAMQAGAISYLEKDIPHEHLAAAIRAAYYGNRTLSQHATQVLINATTRPPQPLYELTERESEVLALMVKGLTNPAIAQQLSISRSTVKYHISSILSKLGAINRSEAVAVALKQKLM